MDYVGPDVEPEEVKGAIRVKRRTVIYGWIRVLSSLLRSWHASHEEVQAAEESKPDDDNAISKRGCHSMAGDKVSTDTDTVMPSEGALSCDSTPSLMETGFQHLSPITSPELSIQPMERTHHQYREHLHLPFLLQTQNLRSASANREDPLAPSVDHQGLRATKKIMSLGLAFMKSLLNPGTIAILVSLPIALIPSLKALFIEVPSVHMPSAPDGLPPLAFFFDTTTFIGAASVPLGLICLGSALARLNVPRDKEGWRLLPIGAITGIAVGKMIIMPVLGVLLVQGLVKGGVIPRKDKVLQFVCMYATSHL